jgi:hypothetical protein
MPIKNGVLKEILVEMEQFIAPIAGSCGGGGCGGDDGREIFQVYQM